MKDGEPDGKGGRWCASCARSHGVLYACPGYSDEIKARLHTASEQQKANLRDPKWCGEQRATGIPEWALEAMASFAGVKLRGGEPS